MTDFLVNGHSSDYHGSVAGMCGVYRRPHVALRKLEACSLTIKEKVKSVSCGLNEDNEEGRCDVHRSVQLDHDCSGL